MGHRLDVLVLDSDGDPVAGTEVTIDIIGGWTGRSLDAHTDDGGHAEFETAADYEDSRELYIRVRAQSFGRTPNGFAHEDARDRQLADRLFGSVKGRHAEIEPPADHEDSGEPFIWVRVQSFGPYRVGDGVYTVQLD